MSTNRKSEILHASCIASVCFLLTVPTERIGSTFGPMVIVFLIVCSIGVTVGIGLLNSRQVATISVLCVVFHRLGNDEGTTNHIAKIALVLLSSVLAVLCATDFLKLGRRNRIGTAKQDDQFRVG